jgi:hypothetical protein
MVVDRREKAERLEYIQEHVKTMVVILTQWEAFMDAAIAKAKVSLEELKKNLAKTKM